MTVDRADAAKVELVVKVSPPAATGSAAHTALLARVADLGIVFEPAGPSAPDQLLASHHVALVARETATRAIERLRQCIGVEAAYIKSRGGPPSGEV